MVATTIETHPVELRIKICASLSLKETCRLRQVSKSFKAFLDDDQNANEIARPHLQYHHTRLQRSLDDLCSPNLNVLDAFVNSITHYGLNIAAIAWGAYPETYQLERSMELYQCVSQSATSIFSHPDIFPTLQNIMSMSLYRAVVDARGSGLLAAWKKNRWQSMSRKLQNYRPVLSAHSRTLKAAFPASEDSEDAIQEKIVGLWSRADAFSPSPLGWDGCEPVAFLTTSESGVLRGIWPGVGVDLGLPKIDMFDRRLLAYAIKSQKSVRVAKEAANGRQLTPLEKAALIEDIAVY